MSKKFRRNDVIKFIKNENINMKNKKYSIHDLLMGFNVESEHEDVTHGDVIMTGKIARAHLEEDPLYYVKLLLCVE